MVLVRVNKVHAPCAMHIIVHAHYRMLVTQTQHSSMAARVLSLRRRKNATRFPQKLNLRPFKHVSLHYVPIKRSKKRVNHFKPELLTKMANHMDIVDLTVPSGLDLFQPKPSVLLVSEMRIQDPSENNPVISLADVMIKDPIEDGPLDDVMIRDPRRKDPIVDKKKSDEDEWVKIQQMFPDMVLCPNRKCPKRMMFEKNLGCNNIHCPFCKSSVCFVCHQDITSMEGGYDHFCRDGIYKCKRVDCRHCSLMGQSQQIRSVQEEEQERTAADEQMARDLQMQYGM